MSKSQADDFAAARRKKEKARTKKEREAARNRLVAMDEAHTGNTLRLTQELEKLTGQESRLTILGHLLRGGAPSATDRLLASRLGVRCAELIATRQFGVMVAARGDDVQPVPLDQVAGVRRSVPVDHPWIQSARRLGACLGDQL